MIVNELKNYEGFITMKRFKKSRKCPRCSSGNVLLQDSSNDGVDLYVCFDCNYEFEIEGYNPKHQAEDFDYDLDDDDDNDLENSEEEWRY
jgi:transposase-like protein